MEKENINMVHAVLNKAGASAWYIAYIKFALHPGHYSHSFPSRLSNLAPLAHGDNCARRGTEQSDRDQ
jgi:hypothetical protein